MNKKKDILSIGFEIPGQSENYIYFDSSKSLMDADIIIISPEEISPNGDRIRFSSGGACYDTETTSRYTKHSSNLKKEVSDSLKQGKTVFLFLAEKKEFSLATGVTHPRKGENLYSTTTKSNYDFLPINIGNITSASGNRLIFNGNQILSDFNRNFKDYLKYESYIENSENALITYHGKDKSKILGAIIKGKSGHLVILPKIKYDYNSFVKYDKKTDKEFWTDEAKKFGDKLSEVLIGIDAKLSSSSEKTPPPKWSLDKNYFTKRSLKIETQIKKSLGDIEKLKKKIENFNQELESENQLKDLLFEQGKPLEDAVTKALDILGYKAENYDDGELELDQVIMSPEKVRYIGECEGKDAKDINITKFRQLLESLNADFAREDVEEKAFGILFGNPQRLVEPVKRNLDFTKKCKTGAEREKIALIKTAELFVVTNFLQQNKNAKFKKACRKAISDGLGKIVKFPTLPSKKNDT
ncbi:hypothetical protein [Maribacter sp. HTCC2170]|uniref:hypothetical protein n=1 Tax=Maribacter sp. (strain HTCC2170 / KCCM 42371) TaxID=313603 RepID=UPI00006AFD36|nr:hypothetical protein [Maribacter sp. HTCC2170]EAR01311.1 hypothetical protein FB2170_11341 [Maribacter sp. HTCC2170]